MALKTFLLKNASPSGSAHGSLQESGTAAMVGTATTTTGWDLNLVASGNYSLQIYGTKRATSTFASTALPNASPNTTDSWRSENALTGTFEAGTWSISIPVIAGNATANGSGRFRVRLWRSTSATGATGVTEITSGAVTTSNWSNVTVSVQQNCTATVTLPAVTMAAEYLFIQVALEIVTSISNVTTYLYLCTNAFAGLVTTTDWSGYSGGVMPDMGGTNSPFYNRNATLGAAVSASSGATTKYYAMRGRDSVGYKTWVATGAPDTTGAQYTGSISGSLTDIVILRSW